MTDKEFEEGFASLVKEFGDDALIEYGRLKSLAQKTKNSQDPHIRLEGSESFLQILINFLRLCIKNQQFDLEATRREKEYLRQLAEEKQ